jgi:hypothetical protein
MAHLVEMVCKSAFTTDRGPAEKPGHAMPVRA